MSDDMRWLLKGSAIVAVILLLAGSVSLARSSWYSSRERRAMEESEQDVLRHKQQLQQATQEEINRGAAAKRPAPSQPPHGTRQTQSASLRHIAFSPDGRFLAAAAHYQSVGALLVWPSNGGATLLRRKFDFANSLAIEWKDSKHLIIQGSLWRVHKDKGYWDATEAGRIVLQRTRISADNARNFPRQDVRLEIENHTISKDGVSQVEGRLAAYSLATGARLPLPPPLQKQNDLRNIMPLTRWGKAPLRLTQWKSYDVPSKDGLNQRSELEVWDARAKKRLWKKSFPESDGELLIGGGGKFLIALGTPVRLSATPNQPGTVTYFNGKRVDKLPPGVESNYASDGIEIYDSNRGKLLAKARVKGLERQNLIVSPDGSLLAGIVRSLIQKHLAHRIIFLFIRLEQ